jgi:ribosomal 50S subunit-recycling heat shock protein
MRLDKYLKVTRLIKRRTIAKEVIDQDVVYVNDRIAKPSKEIQEGDIIRLILGKKELTIRVTSLPATSLKKDTKEMYEVLSLKVLNPSQPS